MSLLAIDMGSSSCKAVVFALNGTCARPSQPILHAQHPPALMGGNAARNLLAPRFLPRNLRFWPKTSKRTIPSRRSAFSSHAVTFVAIDDRNRPPSLPQF